ncbi:unnamed protein product [Caenorhabditis angaria]|uniref:Uncharacterized protein n=1 Tax=Caenorhabditis angaria TaxID=860376 RepID=A0A9P1IVA6_9PELO|nr:unnamed protein product [Caenorhabditis angaria]
MVQSYFRNQWVRCMVYYLQIWQEAQIKISWTGQISIKMGENTIFEYDNFTATEYSRYEAPEPSFMTNSSTSLHVKFEQSNLVTLFVLFANEDDKKIIMRHVSTRP